MTITMGCSERDEYWLNEVEVLAGFDGPSVVVEKSRTVLRAGERGSETLSRELISVPAEIGTLEPMSMPCETVEECDQFPRRYALILEADGLSLDVMAPSSSLASVASLDGRTKLLSGAEWLCVVESDTDTDAEPDGTLFKVVPLDAAYQSRQIFSLVDTARTNCISLDAVREIDLTGASQFYLMDVVASGNRHLALIGTSDRSAATRFSGLYVVDLERRKITDVSRPYRNEADGKVGQGVRFWSPAGEMLAGAWQLDESGRNLTVNFTTLDVGETIGQPQRRSVDLAR
ncbi:hypothetical protein [Parerythrobacter jejuensis]